jgi:sigma-B regulation protein RsbU (phosphoserine phosphatase)
LPDWLKQRLAAYERYAGISYARSQLLLLAVAFSVWAIQWLLVDRGNLPSTLIYSFIAGNIVTILMSSAVPLYNQPFPRDWIVYLALLLPVSLVASTAGSVVSRLLLGVSLHSLFNPRGDIPFGAFFCVLIGVSVHIFASNRARLQAANLQLAQQVQYGRQELAAQASDLRDAFEIQSSLLPRTIPQIAGVEVSCAWQPARTVSGDYFDVLILTDSRIALCLADVSGKGMSAALITANLQATLRAFAPDEASPARLCHRLNQALCASLPTGRFVTLVYAILDRKRMTLTYELAGHNMPLLLRGSEVILLPGSGPVLGILPNATFADQTIPLRPGDRIVFSTDGITEAFNPEGEEFGEGRLIAAALAATATAHATRTAIMSAVDTFAHHHFHDDASLIVVRLDS